MKQSWPIQRRRDGMRWRWAATVIAGGLIATMTVPGQTAGLSVFTDPLIEELSTSRTMISLSYLIGTLFGAACQPLIGKASDQWDIRRVIIGIAVAFSAILFGLSFISDMLGLTIGFVGVRMAGQGALSLAATTAISRAITHRRGLALGVSAALGSAGISLAPIGLERLITAVGIQGAWRWEALAVLAIVIPAAFFIKTPPSRKGLSKHWTPGRGWTLAEARHTGMFWVLSAAVAVSSMLTTALAFHQIALLGERGLSPLEAAANFLPQTITTLLATLVVGALIDRADPRIFVIAAMAAMSAALLLVGVVTPGWSAVFYGLVLGAAGGCLRGMEAATFARFYGVKHIGAIRGLSTAFSLGASALGPYVLALGVELDGGFTTPAALLSAIPVIVIIATVVVRPPTHSDGVRPQ
ncbi:MFS-type transporter [Leucobacter komagatae]|uniref:MFS-type transporter n=2 Tax=Leucobacter komagatae TaxID=55969 RepID=A0A0D0IU47_9MICO|nr:MFS-type transporter [Leucobacter komagatae]